MAKTRAEADKYPFTVCSTHCGIVWCIYSIRLMKYQHIATMAPYWSIAIADGGLP